MGKRPPQDKLRLLLRVVEAMAARPEAGSATADARLVRDLAERILDRGDPWEALAAEALERILEEGGTTARAGAPAMAEMLRELLDDDTQDSGAAGAG